MISMFSIIKSFGDDDKYLYDDIDDEEEGDLISYSSLEDRPDYYKQEMSQKELESCPSQVVEPDPEESDEGS